MKNKLILFAVLLLFVGCDKKLTIVRLIAIDTLKTDVIFDDVYFDTATNKEFLIKNNWEKLNGKRTLDFYLFDSNKIEKYKQIIFNSPVIFYNYLVHSFDSIYTIPNGTKHLFLFDGNGNEIQRWALSIFDSDTVVYLPADIPFILNDGILYFYLDAIVYDNYYKQKFIGMLQIENGIIVKSNRIISFPNYYQQEKSYMFYSSPSFLIHKEKKLLISYAVSHNLYLYKNDSVFRTVNAKSNFLDTFRFAEKDNAVNMKQYFEDGHYRKILFDRFRNLYYRVVFHNQFYENPDGTVNQRCENPWSIIVMDSNFRIIDEIFFEAKEFQAHSILNVSFLITSQGLIFNKRIQGEGLFDEDTFKQILYKIELE